MFRPASFLLLLIGGAVSGDDTPPAPPQAVRTEQPDADAALRPLNPDGTVLLDVENKRVLLKAQVCLREGLLEMLICRAQTKEHESILAVDSEAYVIHAGLLAIGAEPGRPVRFEPEFKPPTGQRIDIYVNWTDEEGVAHREPAQRWVRHVTRRYYIAELPELPGDLTIPDESELRYDERRGELIWFGQMTEEERTDLIALSNDKAYRAAIQEFYDSGRSRQLEAEFVFAGSGFYRQRDGTNWYQAEAGNLVCVANFSDAMIDVAIESSAENAGLLFEPFTERVPPEGTPVTIELIPVDEDED